MASQPPRIAFAGLGAMGFGMATHLVNSGFSVTGFDVYQPSLDRFITENPSASAAETPREACQDAHFLIVMVATSVQATPLLFDEQTGAVRGLSENTTIIMCSTVAPAYIAEIQQLLKSAGKQRIRLIDSPVSGGAVRAAAGTLSIFASGAPDDVEHARPVLQCMSDANKLYEIPGGLGGGSNAKLIHQIFAGVHIAMCSEAMGLAALAGWDTKEAFDFLSKGGGSSWMFENRVPPMFDPDHAKYSAVTIIAKDVGIITSTARAHAFPLPVLGAAEQLYLTAVSAGWGAEDDCVLTRLFLPSQPNLVATQAGHPSSTSSPPRISLQTIEDLMVGVHLAGLAEAMRFCTRLGVDEGLMYDIVTNAAGASKVFVEFFEGIRGEGWRLRGGEVERVRERLKEAVEEIYGLKYPLWLGSAALMEMFREREAEAGW
ncbi:MAG: hypothetical protein LQ344_006916 [Seirophora lacunosa]|nr:MAG: hypothetical protein LQ344_006916 [Seirophora lacunosa]